MERPVPARETWLVAALALIAVACGTSPPSSPAPTAPTNTAGFIQSGEVRLAYEIDLPQGGGPFPAVVLGHGSGRMTRHDLRGLANQFRSMGFAVLRFDKRGVGDSTGTYTNVGTANSEMMFPILAGDVAAAAIFLRSQPGIDPARVGLAGVSQAGWILPLAARQLGNTSFMVLLSGPVCSVGLEIYYSDLAEFSSTLTLDDVYARLPAFAGPNGFDPIPVLRAMDTPTLWVLGEDDRSIPVRNTVENLRNLAATGKPYEWRTFPGLGHGLGPAVWADVGTWTARFRR